MTISIRIDSDRGIFLIYVPKNISVLDLKQKLYDENGIYLFN
jgi:hypothetical protein